MLCLNLVYTFPFIVASKVKNFFWNGRLQRFLQLTICRESENNIRMDHCSVYNSTLFGNCFADLSMNELLTLKSSLSKLSMEEDVVENHYLKAVDIKCPESEQEKCQKPSTMALMAEERGYYPTSHASHDPWQAEEKPSKLQTLFQISVTALSFLSFGGYLLCLIVQSIKSKGTTYFHPVTTTQATNGGIKRIKVYRRNRRSSLPPIQASPIYNYNYNSQEPVNPYQYYYNNKM